MMPASEKLGYRPEIDGLRAIAVLAVVAFHAHLPGIGGGFAGVDVFFVISGFLISRLIAEEKARTGRFSLVGFYERRIRRLFPALALVVGLTLLVGWFQLPPGELVLLTRTAFSALAFFSNLYFAKEAGYFQPNAETQPLLHTWSLGVEEQFYILAPFVMLGLLKLPLPWRRLVAGALLLTSLGLAVVAALKLREAAFYWPQTRAYELLIGVALGLRLVPLPTGARTRAAMAAAGLGLVALALVMLPPGAPFPSYLALLPCIGTALVIAASEGGAIPGPAGAGLRAAPMRFFGKISYSLYLWHWPLMVFPALWAQAPLPLWQRLALVVTGVLAAWLSWRFVEMPARHGASRHRLMQVFAPAAGLIALAFGLHSLTEAREGFGHRFGPAMSRALVEAREPKRAPPACDKAGLCTLGEAQAPLRFILWGDSHAYVTMGEFAHQARARGVRGVAAYGGGCPPLLTPEGTSAFGKGKCERPAAEVQRLLRENPGLPVIMTARWAYYTENGEVGEEDRQRAVRSLTGQGREADRAAFRQLLAGTLAQITALGGKPRLIAAVPEFGQDVFLVSTRRLMRGQDPAVRLPLEQFLKRQETVHAAFAAARGQGVPVFSPQAVLCDQTACAGAHEGVPIYGDNNHLTERGVALLAPLLARSLE